MSIVVLGTHIFEGSQNNVDTPLSGQLALGFDQYNELSVKDSEGNVWQVGAPTEITNKLVQITLDDMGLSSFDDFTTALLVTHINSLNINVVAGENYYFEVSSSNDLRMLFILKENTIGVIDIDQNQLITIVEVLDFVTDLSPTVTKPQPKELTWDRKLMINCGDSTTWEMQGLGYGFDYMTSFYRSPGNKMENITGYVNFGSSGYTLNGFVNDVVGTPPTIDTVNNAGIGAWDYFGHNIQVAVSQKTTLLYRSTIPNQEVVWVISFGINDCILYNSIGNQTQSQITNYLSNLLNQAVFNIKKQFPYDTVILRIPNSMSARPYSSSAGFPSPTAYPDFGNDKPTDVALVTKWNNAIKNAYYLSSQKNLNTILLDTSVKIFGIDQSAEIDANLRPFMNNLVHPNSFGYNAIVDEIAYVFTDERIQKDFNRIFEADLRATLMSNNPYDNYENYTNDISKFRLVLHSKFDSISGSNFIDIPFSKTIFDAATNAQPIYIKSGNTINKFNTYTSNVISSTQCRILGVTPTSKFLADKGNTSVYLDALNDSKLLHTSNNESFTGVKSVTNTGTSINNGIILTNNGTTNSYSFGIVNTSSGIGGKINNSSTGDAFVSIGESSSTGFLYVGKNITTNTFTVDKLGNITGNTFVKTGGTSLQFLKADGTIDSTNYVGISASLTSGRIPYTTGTSALADSSKLLWNNTSSDLEINGLSPLFRIKNNLNNYSQYFTVDSGGNLFLKNHEDETIALFLNSVGTSTKPQLAIGHVTNIPLETQLYIYGGQNGANIDARGSVETDEANINLEGNDWETNVNSLGFSYFGSNGRPGTVLGYARNKMGQIRFQNTTTALITSINGTSAVTPIRFGINTAEIGSVNDKGFHYYSDFSSNNTSDPRWLVDKGYVDVAISNITTKQVNISANLTLDATHNNCILKIKGNCTITIPSTLPTDFNCVIRTFAGFTATFVGGSGTTMDAPQGLVLAPTKMATLFKDGSTTTYVLEGELTV